MGGAGGGLGVGRVGGWGTWNLKYWRNRGSVRRKLSDTHMRRAAVRHSAPAADTDSPVPTFRPYFANLAQTVVEKLFDTSHASRRRPTGSCRCLQRCRASTDSTPSAVRLDRWRRPTRPSGAVRFDTRGRPTRTSRRPTHRGRHDTYP